MKESFESKRARGEWTTRILEILGEKQTVEPGRLVVIDRAYSAKTIFKMIGYDCAVLRVETTGCRYGRKQPESQDEVYRYGPGGTEEFFLFSEIRGMQPYLGELVSAEESDRRVLARFDGLCTKDRCYDEQAVQGYGKQRIYWSCAHPEGHEGRCQTFQIQPAHVHLLPPIYERGFTPGRTKVDLKF